MVGPGAILREAAEIVDGPRQETHGEPAETYGRVGRMWSAYLGVPIDARRAAVMMLLLKVARAEGGRYNADDYLDICGYGAIAGSVAAALAAGGEG